MSAEAQLREDAIHVLTQRGGRIDPFRWGWIERRHSRGERVVRLVVFAPGEHAVARWAVGLWHRRGLIVLFVAIGFAAAVAYRHGNPVGPALTAAATSWAMLHCAARGPVRRVRCVRVTVARSAGSVTVRGDLTAFAAVYAVLVLADRFATERVLRAAAFARAWTTCKDRY